MLLSQFHRILPILLTCSAIQYLIFVRESRNCAPCPIRKVSNYRSFYCDLFSCLRFFRIGHSSTILIFFFNLNSLLSPYLESSVFKSLSLFYKHFCVLQLTKLYLEKTKNCLTYVRTDRQLQTVVM